MDEAGKIILGIVNEENEKGGDGSKAKDENLIVEVFSQAKESYEVHSI